MRITNLFRLHLIGAATLVATATPAFAQTAAAANTAANDHFAVQVVTATVSTRATNLQRQPIAINFLDVATAQNPTVRSGRTAIASSSLSRPARN